MGPDQDRIRGLDRRLRRRVDPSLHRLLCLLEPDARDLRRQGRLREHGPAIHRAEEVLVISRYRYGGFSGFVKNVFDRCLGYVLPQFELVGGETHHRRRYDEDKPFRFLFYGPALTEAQKDSAREYVRAVCANIRGHVQEVSFRDCAREEPSTAPPRPARPEGPSF